MGKKIEYKKFEELGPYQTKYIEDIPEAKPRKAKFYCSFCGQEFIADISKVKSGHTRSCGCQSGRAGKYKYNSGDIIGPNNILLKQRLNNLNGIFECPDCGEDFKATIQIIISGDKKRCNKCHDNWQKAFGQRQANNQKRKDAVEATNGKIKPGQKYGHLTVIEKTDKTKNTKRIWKCQCDCDNKTIVEVRSDLLLNGHTQSCGCLGSLGEQTISKILTKLGISFSSQYIFKDCYNPKTGKNLRFDFYLPDYNCCIEYDGKQHFEDTSGWFNNYSFKELQKRDNIKNQYCENNHIKLIRIPYTDYNKINFNYLKELING